MNWLQNLQPDDSCLQSNPACITSQSISLHIQTFSSSLPYPFPPTLRSDFIIKSAPLLYHTVYIQTERRLQTNYHPVISPHGYDIFAHSHTHIQALVRKQIDIQSHKCMQVMPCNSVSFCFISWRQMMCKQTIRRWLQPQEENWKKNCKKRYISTNKSN